MTGINALSSGKSIKGMEDGFSFSEGSQSSSDSAAAMFAAILGGWLNQAGQGQNSGIQSNEPAGKEANSGRYALLGLDGLQSLIGMQVQGLKDQEGFPGNLDILLSQLEKMQNLPPQIDPQGILGEVDLSGMTGKTLGENSPQSELDLYKNIVNNLLKEMSGEIRVKSYQPEESNLLAQQKSEVAAQRFNIGLFAAMDGEGQPLVTDRNLNVNTYLSQPTQVDKGSSGLAVNQTLANPDSVLAEESAPRGAQGEFQGAISAKSVSGQDGAVALEKQRNSMENITQDILKDTSEEATKEAPKDIIKDIPKEMHGELSKGSSMENNIAKGPGVLSDRGNSDNPIIGKQETSKGITLGSKGTIENGLSSQREILGKLKENSNKEDAPKIEQNHTEEVRTEGASGLSLKDITTPGKGQVQASPVWNQVADEIFAKAFQARPQLREMTIQLHPAELGTINISMSWEEGQVHVRMVAADAGTGQMLQANLSELRDNLTQLGIQCGMMEMGLGEQNEGSQGQQGQSGSARSNENINESIDLPTAEDMEGLIDTEVGTQGSNRINVTA